MPDAREQPQCLTHWRNCFRTINLWENMILILSPGHRNLQRFAEEGVNWANERCLEWDAVPVPASCMIFRIKNTGMNLYFIAFSFALS